jgi:hypothetical protein
MNQLFKKRSNHVALSIAVVLASLSATSCTPEETRRGAWGAAGGAVVGSLIGNRSSAAAGAVIGGLLGAGTARNRGYRY